MDGDFARHDDAYKVNSLTGLDRASPVEGTVVWDPARSIWNACMLLGALILAPLFVSWGAVAIFLGLAAATLCAGHSVGFHRRLIHRSFDCSKWMERTLVWFGTVVGIGGPLWTIRLHDSRDWAQRQADCHPFLRHANPIWLDGLLYLHGRLRLMRPPGFDPGREIADDPFYRFLDRTWMLHQVPIAAALFLIGGWPWVVWGVCVRVAACTTMHWFISYFAHTRGPSDWIVDDAVIQAHNVPLMAIPTMGESWHGNHHAFPSSARHGLYPGQIDLGWQFVRLLEVLGTARLERESAGDPAAAPWHYSCDGSSASGGRSGASCHFEAARLSADRGGSAGCISAGAPSRPKPNERSDSGLAASDPVSLLRLPNFAWRRAAIQRHDLHHVLTGYPCTMRGECLMATWEFAAGPFPCVSATLFCLPLIAVGSVWSPRSIWLAFRRGREGSSHVCVELTEPLLLAPLATLRERAGGLAHSPARVGDIFAVLRAGSKGLAAGRGADWLACRPDHEVGTGLSCVCGPGSSVRKSTISTQSNNRTGFSASASTLCCTSHARD